MTRAYDVIVEPAATMLLAGTTADILIPASDTGKTFTLLRMTKPPGCWTPLHAHEMEDETVLVLSGTLRAEAKGEVQDLEPSQALVLPRRGTHRLGNVSTQAATFLVLCTPGGFDGFVREAGRPIGNVTGAPGMTPADAARMREAAPRFGITLLPPAPPSEPRLPRTAAEPEWLDVLGIDIAVLAEFGCGDDDVSLLRGRIPPGGTVPLHSHADREVFYVLSGELEVGTGLADATEWSTVRTGVVASVQSGIPHALRNRGDMACEVVLLTTRRIAGLFQEAGRAALGPDTFAAAARQRGFWLA